MKVLLSTFAPALLLGCQADSAHVPAQDPHGASIASDDEDGEDETEVVIALDQIPPHVRAAALAAVPGLVIEEAELETTSTGEEQYCLHGTVDGERAEVEVAADGTVLEIEHGDDEDEEDDEG